MAHPISERGYHPQGLTGRAQKVPSSPGRAPAHLTTALGTGKLSPPAEKLLYKSHILPPKLGLLVSRWGLGVDSLGAP